MRECEFPAGLPGDRSAEFRGDVCLETSLLVRVDQIGLYLGMGGEKFLAALESHDHQSRAVGVGLRRSFRDDRGRKQVAGYGCPVLGSTVWTIFRPLESVRNLR